MRVQVDKTIGGTRSELIRDQPRAVLLQSHVVSELILALPIAIAVDRRPFVASLRHCPGGLPTMALKVRVNAAWSANPVCRATSDSGHTE